MRTILYGVVCVGALAACSDAKHQEQAAKTTATISAKAGDDSVEGKTCVFAKQGVCAELDIGTRNLDYRQSRVSDVCLSFGGQMQVAPCGEEYHGENGCGGSSMNPTNSETAGYKIAMNPAIFEPAKERLKEFKKYFGCPNPVLWTDLISELLNSP